MSSESRMMAGILFLVLPTVMYGGVSILRFLVGTPEYMANPLRQDLWRANTEPAQRKRHLRMEMRYWLGPAQALLASAT
jgi:hypothetical protein